MTTRSLLFALAAAVGLAGCDSWLGEPEGPPLPGERISVLAHEQTIKPDPGTQDAQILLPRPTPNKAWPQAGGYANHAMHHVAVGGALAYAWSRDIGAGSDGEERFVSTPVVADGRVFAMDAESMVSAFDARSGDFLWEIELTPDEEDDGHIGGGLAYENGRVFVTTGFNEVVALDAASGKMLWRSRVGAPMRAAPTVRGGRVFAVTVINELHALAASDGHSLWTHSGITETAALLGGASPAVDKGVVVVPYSSGELVALKVENGQMLWTDSLASMRRTDELSTLAHIRGRPIIDRGRVYALSHGELMVAIDMASGRRIWEKRLGGIESPWIAGDYLYVLTTEGQLVCLGREDGRVFWVTDLPRWEDPEDKEIPVIWTGPLLVSDRLIVAGSNEYALAVSPYSGRILGHQEMPDDISVAPIVANETVYFLSDDAELTAYR